MIENLCRLDFVIHNTQTGEDKEVTVLFNSTVISKEEVRKLVAFDEYEEDIRLIVTTPLRANNMEGNYSLGQFVFMKL